jgi:DNA-directed RNA polymerase delta subunit
MDINNNTIFKKSNDLLEAPMEDSLALMSIEQGKYYGMNPVAKFIWEQLAEPISFKDLIDLLLNKYEIEDDSCKEQTLHFLSELLDKKMIGKV